MKKKVIPIYVISMIGNNLCTTIGEGNAIFSLDNSVLILGLLLVEVGPGVVVGNSVSVGDGSGWDLDLSIGWWWGSVGDGVHGPGGAGEG